MKFLYKILGLNNDVLGGGKFLVIIVVTSIVSAVISNIISTLTYGAGTSFVLFGTIISIGITILAFIIGSIVTRKRLESMNMNKTLFLLIFVPLLNLFFVLYLAFTKGKPNLEVPKPPIAPTPPPQ